MIQPSYGLWRLLLAWLCFVDHNNGRSDLWRETSKVMKGISSPSTVKSAGFSVTLGSTGCSGSAGMSPGKFVKLDFLKCNFLRSLRWCTNEKWAILIQTDVLWSKVRVCCRRICLVSYSCYGRGKGMRNDELWFYYTCIWQELSLLSFRLYVLHN